MNGILLVDKPKGLTSHDVVFKIRKKFKLKKVGHGGTLDPLATGLLLILIGKATKQSNNFTQAKKGYNFACRLGLSTDTDDAEGRVIKIADFHQLSNNEIKKAVMSFKGEVSQEVPRYSAVKVNGKKLYELARQGKKVRLPKRKVHIYDLKVKRINPPLISLEIMCSKGTYIRSICRDLGKKLGCGGITSKLKRTYIEPYDIREAYKLDIIEGMSKKELEKALIKTDENI
jgi:tRNA pseudouridine55 synthase